MNKPKLLEKSTRHISSPEDRITSIKHCAPRISYKMARYDEGTNQPKLRRVYTIYDTIYLFTSIIGDECLIEVIRSSGEEMWRVDAYQIPYYSRGIEGEKRTHPRFADNNIVYCYIMVNQIKDTWFLRFG
jgi:hypothetical protein